MKSVVCRNLLDRPTPDEVERDATNFLNDLAQYYLALLVRLGPGQLKAEKPEVGDVQWTHTSLKPGAAPDVVDVLPRALFSPMLARLAFQTLGTEALYGGAGTFELITDDRPRQPAGLFMIYLANLREWGYWVKIYFYTTQIGPPESHK